MSVRSLTSERDSLFDQLQLRQAELESSQSHLETQQSSASELQFRLREAEDRYGLAVEELAETRRELEFQSFQPPPPPAKGADSSSLAASMETKYEAKLEEFRLRVAELDKDRIAIESALNSTIAAKTQEIEELKSRIELSAFTTGKCESELASMRRTIEDLNQEIAISRTQVANVHATEQKVNDLEVRPLPTTLLGVGLH